MRVRGAAISPGSSVDFQDVATDVIVGVGDSYVGVQSALKNSGVICIRARCEFGLEAE